MGRERLLRKRSACSVRSIAPRAICDTECMERETNMSKAIELSRSIKLSICITTRNRASHIVRVLESILEQITTDCEVVILDAASTDNTQACIQDCLRRSPLLRYIRAEVNNGIDVDYDRTVELARGEYCWLSTDDDLFKRHAIETIMTILQEDYSLVITNASAVSAANSRQLEKSYLKFTADREYESHEMDQLFIDTASVLTYIGSIVIRRSLWLERDRRRYYGSFFIHIGVIFQRRLPGRAKAVAKPLKEITQGNERSWAPRVCEIIFFHMPRLTESLALSSTAKNRWAKPWVITRELLVLRACGLYSISEYRRWIFPNELALRERLLPFVVALLPIAIVNALMIAYYSVFHPNSSYLTWLRNGHI